MERRAYFGVVENEKKLYFMPGMSNFFAEYNPHTKAKRLYPYKVKTDKPNGLYGSLVKHKQVIYMLPVREKCICKFNKWRYRFNISKFRINILYIIPYTREKGKVK